MLLRPVLLPGDSISLRLRRLVAGLVQRKKFRSQYFVLPPGRIIPAVFHTHRHPNTTVRRRTRSGKLSSKAGLFRILGGRLECYALSLVAKRNCLTMNTKALRSFRNVGNYLADLRASHPRRLASSATSL
jgi:hypothetical protein